MFTDLKDYIIEHGIKNVLVAGPNCARIFNEYAPDLTTRSIYEVLAEHPLFDQQKVAATVTVHDPCVSRADTATRVAVRQLLERAGVKIEEMPHSNENTICCGEGGGASCLVPEQAQALVDQRLDEAKGRPIASYCAGCNHRFSKHTITAHILDLLFEPEIALTDKHRVTRAPVTYLERLKFKKRIQRNVTAANTRERTFASKEYPTSRQALKKMAIAVMIL